MSSDEPVAEGSGEIDLGFPRGAVEEDLGLRASDFGQQTDPASEPDRASDPEPASDPAPDPVSEPDPDSDSDPEAGGPKPEALYDTDLAHLVEALIFASDKPVTLQRLKQLTHVRDVSRLEAALATIAAAYTDRGIALQQVSGGYQFRTNTQFSAWVQQLIAGRPVRLSRAQLETLAIIAYRQPITRPEIDDIRGVDSSNTLRVLLDRTLIRILGKKEEAGRPLLYGTTKEFLDFFSLGDLRELPTLREYSELTEESQQLVDATQSALDAALDEATDPATESSDSSDAS